MTPKRYALLHALCLWWFDRQRWQHRRESKRRYMFWMRCPVCGRFFGGSEVYSHSDHSALFTGQVNLEGIPIGRLVCTDETCRAVARQSIIVHRVQQVVTELVRRKLTRAPGAEG